MMSPLTIVQKETRNLSAGLLLLLQWCTATIAAMANCTVVPIPDDLRAANLEAEATLAEARGPDGTPQVDVLRPAVMQSRFPWVGAAVGLAGHDHLRVPIHKALDEIERAEEEQSLVLAELQGGAAYWALEQEACRSAICSHEAAMREAARATASAAAAPAAAPNTAPERMELWVARCALKRQQEKARAAVASVAWLESYASSTAELQQAAVMTHDKLAQRRAAGDMAARSDPSLDAALVAAAEEEDFEEDNEERGGFDEDAEDADEQDGET